MTKSVQPQLFFGSLATLYAGWWVFLWEIFLVGVTRRHVLDGEFVDDYATLLGYVYRHFMSEVCR